MQLPGNKRVHPSPRHATWPWAAGSILAVVLVIGGALVGHRITSSLRERAAAVPAPALAPLDVVAATAPGTHIGVSALDAGVGHIVALATSGDWPQCPPVGACPAAPVYDSLLLLDAGTGQTLHQTALTARDARLLLVDPVTHAAYAVGNRQAQGFSAATGEPLAASSIPADISWQSTRGGTLDPGDDRLLLTDGSNLLALDAPTGRVLAQHPLPPGASWTDGPVLDSSLSRLYVLERSPSSATLLAYDASTLAPAGRWELLAGARLGPLDDATHSLYMFEPNGTVSRLTAAVSGQDTTSLASSVVPALDGAAALGWNDALGHMYAAGPDSLLVRDAASGQELASLPVRAAAAPDSELAVDSAHDLVYLPTATGELVIARDQPSGPLSPATALLLGRVAMAHFLPDTNQDPPFVTPQTFPAGAGTRRLNYWIHFSDLGWQGPYNGSASSAVSPESGHPGAFVTTFTIAWYQLFPRSHTWVCEVRPDGSVAVQSQSGDVVP